MSYTTIWTDYGQWVWHRPNLLTLTVWLSNVGPVSLIFPLILLFKWGLRPISMLRSLRDGWALCLLAPCIIVLWLSLIKLLFLCLFQLLLIQFYELPLLVVHHYIIKCQVLIQHPCTNCMNVTSCRMIMLCQ